MTKEELKQEAEENSKIVYGYINDAYVLGHIESAEPREKKIESLGKRCLQLQKDKGRLTDELTKAKEIIKELVRAEYADFTNGDYSKELSKVLEQAEQFLKEEQNVFNQ